jgi:carbonic anhydrase
MSGVLIALALLLAPALSQDVSYTQNGADWSGTCATGTAQSPINVAGYTEVDDSDGYAPIAMSYLASSSFTKLLEGRNYKITGDFGSMTAVDVSKSNNNTYSCTGFNFHAPAEHTLDGHQYALEVHVKHELDSSSASNPYNLAYVIALFEEGPENSFLSTVQTASPASIDLNSLFGSSNMSNYYMYKGSSTSPPCAENVDIYIYGEVLTASAAQIKVFTDLWASNPNFANGRGNNRAVKSLNGRTLLHYDDSAAATTVLGFLFGLSLVA